MGCGYAALGELWWLWVTLCWLLALAGGVTIQGRRLWCKHGRGRGTMVKHGAVAEMGAMELVVVLLEYNLING